MNHKTFAMIFGLILVLPVVAAQSASTVQTTILKYDPAPAEPGKFLDLWVGVQNRGQGSLLDQSVEIIEGYPFFLAAGEDSVRTFPIIDSNGIIAKYKLRVAEDAPGEESVLRVKVGKTGSNLFSTSELMVSVLGKVDVSVKSVEPSELRPGTPTKVIFVFENGGQAPVKDLEIVWSDPNRKILPLGEENRHKIRQLDVGQTEEVEFKVVADPSITQGVHLVDVNMTFQRFGATDVRKSQVAFIVGGQTNFDVAQQDYEDGILSLSVANIGVNTATGVLISVPEQDGWDIVGGSSVFLGNLDSGDFTVASIEMTPLSDDRTQKLKTEISYTDTTGIRQTTEKEITINLFQPKKEEEPNYLVYAAGLLSALIIVFVLNKKLHFLRKKR